jgi:hypothetical protein
MNIPSHSSAAYISPLKTWKITNKKKAATTAQFQPYFQLSLFEHEQFFSAIAFKLQVSEMEMDHQMHTMHQLFWHFL